MSEPVQTFAAWRPKFPKGKTVTLEGVTFRVAATTKRGVALRKIQTTDHGPRTTD